MYTLIYSGYFLDANLSSLNSQTYNYCIHKACYFDCSTLCTYFSIFNSQKYNCHILKTQLYFQFDNMYQLSQSLILKHMTITSLKPRCMNCSKMLYTNFPNFNSQTYDYHICKAQLYQLFKNVMCQFLKLQFSNLQLSHP